MIQLKKEGFYKFRITVTREVNKEDVSPFITLNDEHGWQKKTNYAQCNFDWEGNQGTNSCAIIVLTRFFPANHEVFVSTNVTSFVKSRNVTRMEIEYLGKE